MNTNLSLGFKLKMGFFSAIATSTTIGFFILQGALISSAIEANAFVFYRLATALVIVKFSQVVLLAYLEYLSEHEKVNFRSHLSAHLFPQQLTRNQRSLAPAVVFNMEQTIPVLFTSQFKLFRIQLDLVINLFFFAVSFYFNPFASGALILVPVILLVLLKEFLTNRGLQETLKKSKLCEESLHRGVHEYFDSYNELSFNWKGTTHQILSELFRQTSLLRAKIGKLILMRDLISGSMIEVPYTLLTLTILYGLLRQQLPLTQIFVWFGLAQILIPSIQNLRQLRELRLQKDLQTKHFNKLKNKLEVTPQLLVKTGNELAATFRLRDGSCAFVGNRPGVYHIKGGNGSGKTTLVDTLIGQNDDYEGWPCDLVAKFQTHFKPETVRVITRSSVVLSNFSTLREQIIGEHGLFEFEKHLENILPNNLGQIWIEKFRNLEHAISERPTLELSQGESVLLSLFRCFSKWDSKVKLVVVDECDSNLDYSTRQLFYNTINWLAKTTSVYWISHLEGFTFEEPTPVFRFPITLLAIGDQTSSIRHCNLIAEIVADGKNQIVATGPVASVLALELDRVRKIAEFHRFDKPLHFGFSVQLVDGETHFVVSETQSASLTAALLLKRLQLLGNNQIDQSPIVATGVVTADGSIISSRGENLKVQSWKSSFIYPVETCKDWHSLKEVLG